jgi:tape measure domain-containing protein
MATIKELLVRFKGDTKGLQAAASKASASIGAVSDKVKEASLSYKSLNGVNLTTVSDSLRRVGGASSFLSERSLLAVGSMKMAGVEAAKTAGIMNAYEASMARASFANKKFISTAGLFPRVSSSLKAMVAAAAPLVGIYGAIKAVKLSDTFTNIEQRLKNVTNSTEEYVEVSNKLFAIAQETGSEFTSAADAYVKLSVSLDDNIKSATDLTKVVDILNRGFAASGTTANTAAGATLQLTQGLATNFKAAGQELNSIIEGAPLLAKTIAVELGGKGATDLKKFAQEGKLTSETFLLALQAAEETIKGFEIPQTVGRSFQGLRNEFLLMIGATDDATDSTNGLIASIEFFTNRIKEMRTTIQLIGPSFRLIFAQVNAAINSGAVSFQDFVISTRTGIENLTRGLIKFKQLDIGVFKKDFTPQIEEAKNEIAGLIEGLKQVSEQETAAVEKSNAAMSARAKLADALARTSSELTKDQMKRQKELSKSASEEIKRQQEEVRELKNNFADLFSEGINGFDSLRDAAISAITDIARNIARLQIGGSADSGLGGSIAQGLFNVLGQSSTIANTASFSSRSTASIAASAASGAFGPGFATGGSMRVGGVGGTDSQLVQFRATPNERITVEKPGQSLGGSNVNVNVINNTDSQATVSEETTSRGRDITVVIDKISARNIQNPSSATARALKNVGNTPLSRG